MSTITLWNVLLPCINIVVCMCSSNKGTHAHHNIFRHYFALVNSLVIHKLWNKNMPIAHFAYAKGITIWIFSVIQTKNLKIVTMQNMWLLMGFQLSLFIKICFHLQLECRITPLSTTSAILDTYIRGSDLFKTSDNLYRRRIFVFQRFPIFSNIIRRSQLI